MLVLSKYVSLKTTIHISYKVCTIQFILLQANINFTSSKYIHLNIKGSLFGFSLMISAHLIERLIIEYLRDAFLPIRRIAIFTYVL